MPHEKFLCVMLKPSPGGICLLPPLRIPFDSGRLINYNFLSVDMSEKSTDYEAIKIEYIREKISLVKLAERHKVSYSTLYKKASNEDWAEERKKYGEMVVKKIYNRMSNEDAKKYAKYESSLKRISALLEDSLKNGEINKFRVDVDGNPREVIRLDMVNTQHTKEILSLLSEVEKQMSRLIGILPVEKQKEYELEKIRIEAENNAAENSEANEDMPSSGVIILPPRLEDKDD